METRSTTVLCSQCDAVYRRPSLLEGHDATCLRCGAVVVNGTKPTAVKTAMLLVASMALYLVASYAPMITVSVQGLRRDVTVWKALTSLLLGTWGTVAVPVMALSFLIPLIQSGLTGWLLAFACHGIQAPGFSAVRRWVRRLYPWSMADVLLVAMVLAAIRMAPEAQVDLRGNFWLLLAACIGLSASNRRSLGWIEQDFRGLIRWSGRAR